MISKWKILKFIASQKDIKLLFGVHQSGVSHSEWLLIIKEESLNGKMSGYHRHFYILLRRVSLYSIYFKLWFASWKIFWNCFSFFRTARFNWIKNWFKNSWGFIRRFLNEFSKHLNQALINDATDKPSTCLFR